MARLYADENFSQRVVELLRAFGHDVITTKEAGNAGLGISDPEVEAGYAKIFNFNKYPWKTRPY